MGGGAGHVLAPNQTKSLKPHGFRWDVGVPGLLPSESFHEARGQGGPSPVPGKPSIPGTPGTVCLGGCGSPHRCSVR